MLKVVVTSPSSHNNRGSVQGKGWCGGPGSHLHTCCGIFSVLTNISLLLWSEQSTTVYYSECIRQCPETSLVLPQRSAIHRLQEHSEAQTEHSSNSITLIQMEMTTHMNPILAAPQSLLLYCLKQAAWKNYWQAPKPHTESVTRVCWVWSWGQGQKVNYSLSQHCTGDKALSIIYE